MFTEAISTQIVATRHTKLLVCDKTPASVIGYTKLLLQDLSVDDRRVLSSMEVLSREWSKKYDFVFLLSDRFGGEILYDPIRNSVAGLQEEVEATLRSAFHESDVTMIDVPVELSLEERVAWIIRRITPLTAQG